MKARLGSVTLALLCFGLLLPALASAFDPQWTLGVGGSLATKYTYKTIQFSSGFAGDYAFGNTWSAGLGVNRRLSGPFSLQTDLEYLGKQENPAEFENVRIALWSLGVRATSTRAGHLSPYAQVLPSLFWAKWTDELNDYFRSSVRPGITVGTGVVIGSTSSPVKLDLGIKGLLSTAWPPLPISKVVPPTYHGVKRLEYGGRLLYVF